MLILNLNTKTWRFSCLFFGNYYTLKSFKKTPSVDALTLPIRDGNYNVCNQIFIFCQELPDYDMNNSSFSKCLGNKNGYEIYSVCNYATNSLTRKYLKKCFNSLTVFAVSF